MQKIIIFTACILLCTGQCYATKRIFPIGDSTWERVDDYVIAHPPRGYVIDTTSYDLNYGGKRLQHWVAGSGGGDCEDELEMYSCLEIADFDVVWIYSLWINDFSQFNDETYANANTYLAAWRSFYEQIHTSFPLAKIVHSTGYPVRPDTDGDTLCYAVVIGEPLYVYGGSVAPVTDATACFESEAGRQPCFDMLNGSWRHLKKLLMAANADLPYLYYIDSWDAVVADHNGDTLEDWTDTVMETATTGDCIHMQGNYYNDFYDTYIKNAFESLPFNEYGVIR